MKDEKYRKLIVIMVCIGCVSLLSVFCSLLQIQNLKHMESRMEFVENMLLTMNRAGFSETGEDATAPSAEGTETADAASVVVEQQINLAGNPAIVKEKKDDPYAGMRKVCLTFDDGPSIYTDDILDVLDKYGVKASFFVNGKSGFDEQYRRIVAEGHTLGMHSFSHDYSEVYADLDSFAEDLYKLKDYLFELTGVDCELYRFPGGSSNTASRVDMTRCIQYLDAKGIRYFDWNVSSGDATSEYRSAASITSNVISQIQALDKDTIVVLFHDASGKSTTVEALPMIIEKIQAMDNTVILPIDEYTEEVQHISVKD